MKTLLTIVIATMSFLSTGQTDIIEMRSRSSSFKKYVKSIERKSSDHVASNFGMAPPDRTFNTPVLLELSKAILDSVNWVSDSVAIMYTSGQCANPTNLNPEVASIWQPGSDTVINHPLFSKKHSLDSVKLILDRDYIFYKSSDSTKFNGYDNGEGDAKLKTAEPIKQKRESKKNAFGWELIFMIITPIGFVIGMNKLKLI